MNSIKAVSRLNTQNISPRISTSREHLLTQQTTGDRKLNTNPQSGSGRGLESQLASALETFNQRWDSAQNDFQQKLKTLAPQFRSTFELQRKVQELNFSTQLATQIGEALNSSLRKLQAAQG